MANLILMRHGASAWNTRNLFTGWVDVPLSAEGIEEAKKAGELLKDVPIEVIFCSGLIRATMTAMIAMSVHSSKRVPVIQHDAKSKLGELSTIYSDKTLHEIIPTFIANELNERQYGELQGRDKDECRQVFGEDQVHIWRRSFDVPPPEGESLKMTAARSLPYFEQKILPFLKKGQNVLVSAHGNSLRSIIMKLNNLTEKEVVALELPTGKPIIYHYTEKGFHETDHIPR